MKTKSWLDSSLCCLGISGTLIFGACAQPFDLNTNGIVGWGAGRASTGNFPEYGQSLAPVVTGPLTEIAAGFYHNLALTAVGTVVAWGRGDEGQTILPAGLTDVTTVAAGGYHSAVVKRDGTVVAWGYNNYGQATVPAGLGGVISVAAGGEHTAALKRDGTVLVWGRGDDGQTDVPPGLSGVIAIAAGHYHTVALKNDGTVVAWGAGKSNTGIGYERGQSDVPAGLIGVTGIAAGIAHTVALKSDGTVVAWGAGTTSAGSPYDYGQSAIPSGLKDVVAVAAGYVHTVALKRDGTVVAWGLGDGGQTRVPADLSGVIAISAGVYHSLALRGGVLPTIIAQPQGVMANMGATVNFTVGTTNALTYQWTKDGNLLPGATNGTIVLTNVEPVNIGDYRVVVSGGFGSVTSAPAALNLNGVNASLWKGLVAWFPFNGSMTDKVGLSTNIAIKNVSPTFNRYGEPQGAIRFSTSQRSRFSFSNATIPHGFAPMSVSLWLELEAQTIPPGGYAKYEVFGGGSDIANRWNLHFILQGNGIDVTSVESFRGNTGYLGAYSKAGFFENQSAALKLHHLTLSFRSPNETAIFLDGKPIAWDNPPNTNTAARTAGLFYIGSSSIDESFNGIIDDVRIYNRALTDVEVYDLYQTERVPDTVIVSAPQAATVSVGGTVKLTVMATNPVPTMRLNYQWSKDGVPLAGQTGPELDLGVLEPAEIGNYTVTVEDSSRSQTTEPVLVNLRGVDSGLWRGLVAFYPLDGTYRDETGMGDELVPYGLVDFVSVGHRPESGAARVQGTEGFLVGPERVWIAGASPRTISIWMKPDGVSRTPGTVASLGSIQNCGERFSLQWTTNQTGLRFLGGDCPGSVRSRAFTTANLAGKWTHVVLTYDGTFLRCYVNGLGVGPGYAVPLDTDGLAPVVLGNMVGTDGEGFTGWVDDVRIYNRALSAVEVRNLYNFEAAGIAPSLPQITLQPQPLTAYEGETLRLSVEATGYQLGFRWQKNGQDLVSDGRVQGVNASELIMRAARVTDVGSYRVLVTNVFGSVTSADVGIAVLPPVRVLTVGFATEVQEGQRMVFPLSFTTPGNVSGVTFRLSYDPAFLADPQVEWAAQAGQGVNTVNTASPGEIMAAFSLAGSALPAGSNALARVSFRARSVPAITNVSVLPMILSVADPAGTALMNGNGALPGEGRIKPRRLKGDNNANQRLDIGDAVVMSRLQVGLEVGREWDVPLNDLNETGDLDNGDVIRVLRTVVGLDPQPVPGGGTTRSRQGRQHSPLPLANTNEVLALEFPDGSVATLGQPWRVVVRLEKSRQAPSGLNFTLRFPAGLTLVGKQVGALVPAGALPLWGEVSGGLTFAAVSPDVWPASTGVAAVITFTANEGLAAQDDWLVSVVPAELTFNGYEIRSMDHVSGVVRSSRVSLVPPVMALRPPEADGRLSLEVSAGPGEEVVLETTTDLIVWSESQRVTGRGMGLPVSVWVARQEGVEERFWRLRRP